MPKSVFIFAIFAFVGSLSAQTPFVGTWNLDAAQTKYTRGEPQSQHATVVVQHEGDHAKITSTSTDATGKEAVATYTVPENGGAGTIQEGVPVDSIRSKRPSVNVSELSFVKNGKEVLSRRSVVSEDGKTMRSSVKGIDASGKPFAGTEIYHKQ